MSRCPKCDLRDPTLPPPRAAAMADTNEVHVGGIWFCKIGEHSPLQRGADSPMRDAVAAEYKKLTGQEPAFIFSGWGGELTEGERAVVENRLPPTPPADAALADELLRLAGAFDTSLNNAASVSMNKRAADSLRETLIDAAATLRARAVPDDVAKDAAEVVAYRIHYPGGAKRLTEDGDVYEHEKRAGLKIDWLGVVGGIDAASKGAKP